MFKYKLLYICLLLCCILSAQDRDSIFLKLSQQIKVAQTDSLKLEAYLELGRYQLRRDFNEVELYLNEALAIIKRAKPNYDSRLHEAKIKQQFGIIFRKRADYVKSLRNYYEALPIFESMQDSIGLASSYHNIGTVLIYQNEHEKGKKSLKEAIRINEELGRNSSVANNYNMLSKAYKDNNDSVTYFYEKAIKHYETDNNKEGIHQVMANMATFYIRIKEYDKAIDLFLKNLDYVNKIQKKTSIATSHYNLAKIYIRIKDYKKALKHINIAIAIAEEEEMSRRLALSYNRRSLIYRDTKQFDKALKDYRRYSKLFDSIFNSNKLKEIREIELSYKYDKERAIDSLRFQQEKRILVLEKEKESFRKKLYLSLIVLSSIIGFLGIRYFRKRWKTSRAIQNELSERLSLTKEESKKRLKTLNSEIEGLSTEISTRKEEITELMTESLQHLKAKEKLVGDLKKLASNDQEISIQNIISDLRSGAIEDSRLATIKNHLEELNYEFFKTIKQKHPNLTKVDLEICSYLRLSIGRKEIAQLRFTSTEAVKKTRNRLRKKMNLTSGQDLEEYIKSI